MVQDVRLPFSKRRGRRFSSGLGGGGSVGKHRGGHELTADAGVYRRGIKSGPPAGRVWKKGKESTAGLKTGQPQVRENKKFDPRHRQSGSNASEVSFQLGDGFPGAMGRTM